MSAIESFEMMPKRPKLGRKAAVDANVRNWVVSGR